MNACSLTHLADHDPARDLGLLVAKERDDTAAVLAHIAEFDARKLYLPAAYPSMFAYCVGVLHFSEDAAYKQVRAARLAREFPEILPLIAAGKLHLSGLVQLAAYLSRENAQELLAAATHRTKAGIERLVAERFPQSDVSTLVQPVTPPFGASVRPGPLCESSSQLAPGRVGMTNTQHLPAPLAPSTATPAPLVPSAKVAPIAPGRFELRGTMDRAMHDDLCAVQELLGPGAGDAMVVLGRALRLLRRQLEQRRFAATESPRRRRSHAEGRYVPAEVRRAVWQRDGGQCSFVGDSGHRCEARTRLEFDHVTPVARGGDSTTENLRPRCRAHNQFAAERTYGAGFMEGKREQARRERQEAANRRQPLIEAGLRDVTSALRSLGCGAAEARSIAQATSTPGLSLEEHVRLALRSLAPRCTHVPAPRDTTRPMAGSS